MYTATRTVRPPTCAGEYYPRDAYLLSNTIDRLLKRSHPRKDMAPKAVIVPHASYRRSGIVAARAFGSLGNICNNIERVVLIGPSHFSSSAGVILPQADAMATPLGEVPIDGELASRARQCEGAVSDDLPHSEEHSLEVQLPFLQHLLGDFTVLPVAVARAPGWAMSALLDSVWGGDETLIVISSDLSQHLDCDSARETDLLTADAIVSLDASALGPDDSCGYYALQGVLPAAESRGLKCHLLGLRNSADADGEGRDTTGFGAFAFE